MTFCYVAQYQFDPTRLEVGLAAARRSLSLFAEAGARPSLYVAHLGGEVTGTYCAVATLASAPERAAFMDWVTTPEHEAADSLEVATRQEGSGVRLLGRMWLTEVAPKSPLPTAHEVTLVGIVDVAPGHMAEADRLLSAWRFERDALKVEAHLWRPEFGGSRADRSTRFLSIGGPSWAEWSAEQTRIQASVAGKPALAEGLESGAFRISQTMWRLVHL